MPRTFYTRFVLPLAALNVALLTGAAALAQEKAPYNPGETVAALFCPDPARLAEIFTNQDVAATATAEGEGCTQFPFAVRVPVEIVSGPFTDYEGDRFFIGRTPAGYIILWPGKNAPAEVPSQSRVI